MEMNEAETQLLSQIMTASEDFLRCVKLFSMHINEPRESRLRLTLRAYFQETMQNVAHDIVLEEAKLIRQIYPQANVEDITTILHNIGNEKNRVKITVRILSNRHCNRLVVSSKSMELFDNIDKAVLSLDSVEKQSHSRHFNKSIDAGDEIPDKCENMEFNFVDVKNEVILPDDVEEYCMYRESGDFSTADLHPSTSKDSEEDLLDDVDLNEIESETGCEDHKESGTETTVGLLTVKSRKLYEKQYEDFRKWLLQKKEQRHTENMLLTYFFEKSKNVKASTLWAQYSMLKCMLMVKKNVDISKFQKLTHFLKRKNNGYKPNKSKTLTAEQVDQFLAEAPDDEFLMVKVALILGIVGACRGDELMNLFTNDVRDLGSSILFNIKNAKAKSERVFIVKNSERYSVDFVELCKKYMSLRSAETEHSRFFVQYKNHKCTVQPVGKNTFGKLPQRIASFLNLPEASSYTGHCFRRTSAFLLANAGSSMELLKGRVGRKVSSDDAANGEKNIAQDAFGLLDENQAEQTTTTSDYISPPLILPHQ